MDLRTVGRPYFSHAETEARLLDFNHAMLELRKRAGTGTPPYDSINTREFAVAGYDLGAQTVQALLGEKIKGIQRPETAQDIRAAILLSPHVDVAGGGIQHRFREIHTPLLVITGTHDQDPWGMTSPSVRMAPWQQAGSSRKVLLTLTQATHRQMAGHDPAALEAEDHEKDPEEMSVREDPEENPMKDAIRQMGGSGQAPSRRGPRPQSDPRHPGQQLSAIQWISAAFLAETLNQDRASATWLRNKAAHWLSGAGVLQNR